MGVVINARLHPFRMVLSRRQPVQLDVEIINRAPEAKMLTMRLILPRTLAIDKGGLTSEVRKPLDMVNPDETKRFYFDIYGKQMARVGEEEILVKVLEHYQTPQYVVKEYTKKIGLIVED